MYQQPNHSYHSTESLRRLSSNNPFRNVSNSSNNSETRYTNSNGTNLVKSPNSNFDSWVAKNKQLIDDENEELDENLNNYLLLDEDYSKPQFPPKPVRANSDSSVYV